jgi:hypothetical protein
VNEAQLSVLVTVGGAAVAVAIIVQIIVSAAQWTAATKDRFGPMLACITGVVVVEVASVGLGVGTRQDIVQGLFTGLFAGASAMGIHDLISGSAKAVSGPSA